VFVAVIILSKGKAGFKPSTFNITCLLYLVPVVNSMVAIHCLLALSLQKK
jgi:hypothetical protein